MPPTTAEIGICAPRQRTLPRILYGLLTSGCLTRRAMIATCAVVNDSIAPNA